MIYLDNAATTPLHPQVREAMLPYLDEEYGNPSSTYAVGRQARSAVEKAREQVARAIGASPDEIVFTSGGTEADNAAIIGAAIANRDKGQHIITTSIEHHAVLHTCEFLEKMGFEVTYIDPGADGIITAESVLSAVRPDTTLVSVMYVNNETGAIQPISTIGQGCAEREVLFHTDAVQAAGVMPINVKSDHIQLLSISSHKLHGPKGVGALYVNRHARWSPILHGGNQERKKRAGTENVPGIVGLGAAIERITDQLADKRQHLSSLKHRMLEILRSEVDEVVVNSPENSSPSILSVSFPGASADVILMNLDIQKVAAASGSACTSGSVLPSHVLMAMNAEEDCVKSAIRFSFSELNTLQEVETAAKITADTVNRVRK